MFLRKGVSIIIAAVIAIGGFYVYSQQQKAVPLSKLPQYEIRLERPAELPKLAPVDFPIYPDVEVVRMESKPPTDFAVGFASEGIPQKIFTYLLENANKNNWQVIEQQGLIFRSIKGKTTVTISVSQNPGQKTAILEQVKFAQ